MPEKNLFWYVLLNSTAFAVSTGMIVLPLQWNFITPLLYLQLNLMMVSYFISMISMATTGAGVALSLVGSLFFAIYNYDV